MLSGFQRYFCMQYTTVGLEVGEEDGLCYQDFKDTFVCNTQQHHRCSNSLRSCVIRISKILLYAIHNESNAHTMRTLCCVIRISKILLYAIHNQSILLISPQLVVLSGFQRYFCMQYTTIAALGIIATRLCYQDFKDTFVCNTQQCEKKMTDLLRCVIRISKILLYAIHNRSTMCNSRRSVVLSGFQRYFCMQYTTGATVGVVARVLCYQDFKDTLIERKGT